MIVYLIFIAIILLLVIYIILEKRKIYHIAQHLKELLNGNYQNLIFLKSKGAIGQLIDGINRLTEDFNKKTINYKQSSEFLLGILNNISSGAILTELDGRILKTSASFKKNFMSDDETKYDYIQEIFINKDFIEFTKVNDSIDKPAQIEIFLQNIGKHFEIIRVPLKESKRIIYIFTDITAAKDIKRIKSEIVTNLSHELRTPLTVIKGYLESLGDKNIDDKTREKFLNIITENIDRLTNILSDLLLLSDFERPEKRLKIEKIDLSQLAQEAILFFHKMAENKGLQLKFSPVKIPSFWGDRFMLQQLFINLLSNAIRFTEKGSVELKIEYKDNKFTIMVKDTGIGIPDDEIPKIFERFYTLDKARSRQQGGTGLGLSIVKHIVQAHKGEIKVLSKLGTGSDFIITLPQIEPVS